MFFDLKASTDCAECAIFDPQALTHMLDQDITDFHFGAGTENLIERESLLGNLLTFNPASDGSYIFRFYIDEPAPVELIRNAINKTEGLLLRVPKGKLCAAGIEYLPSKEMKLARIEDYNVGKLGQCREIEPGNYKVDAYSFCSSKHSSVTVNAFSIAGCLGLIVAVLLTSLFGWWWTIVIAIALFLAGIQERPANSHAKGQQDAIFVLMRVPLEVDTVNMRGGGIEAFESK